MAKVTFRKSSIANYTVKITRKSDPAFLTTRVISSDWETTFYNTDEYTITYDVTTSRSIYWYLNGYSNYPIGNTPKGSISFTPGTGGTEYVFSLAANTDPVRKITIQKGDSNVASVIAKCAGYTDITTSGYYLQGKSITITATVSKDGYEFDGWYYSTGTKLTSNLSYTFTVGNTDQTFVAKSRLKTNSWKFYQDSTLLSSVDVYINKQLSVRSAAAIKTSKQSVGITVLWDKNNANASISSSSTSLSSSRTLTYSSPLWKSSYKNLTPGSTITIYNADLRDVNYNLEYTEAEQSDVVPVSVGTIPTAECFGYKFKGFYTDRTYDDQKISSTYKVDSNKTFYAHWEPKTYRIVYSENNSGINFSKSRWSDAGKPQTDTKTFGVGLRITAEIPSRPGYTFVGWHTDKDINYSSSDIIAPGALLDDRFNSSEWHDTINLYCIWKPIKNKLKVHYSLDDRTLITEEVEFDIESGYRDTDNPGTYQWKFKGPSRSRGGDWVMFGIWSQEDNVTETPQGWTYGTYKIKSNAPPVYTTDYIVDLKARMTKEWPSGNIGWIEGYTNHLYLFWTITGKHVKVGNDWKPCTEMYCKVDELTWKPVTDFWVKTSAGWKHEIN